MVFDAVASFSSVNMTVHPVVRQSDRDTFQCAARSAHSRVHLCDHDPHARTLLPHTRLLDGEMWSVRIRDAAAVSSCEVLGNDEVKMVRQHHAAAQ